MSDFLERRYGEQRAEPLRAEQLRAMRGRVLVRRRYESTEGSIIVPEAYRVQTKECEVVSVGAGEDCDRLGIKRGDVVIVRGNKGDPARYGTLREELLLSVRWQDVEAVVE